HWGIGSKAQSDGLLLIVAPSERKVRIEVGYGLEKRISDPFAAQVIREQALPRFREGRFPEGIEAASEALMKRLLPPRPDKDAAPAGAEPAAAEKVPA
ncbi:MAG TPA: TPM domain-containing protein, partial [Allosphingosinicella sp.]